ncbi:MAG: SurA N-terminal domain-containing protein [bacterium]
MLTELREKSQSFGIYVLFGMLIVVFIFFFGPQSEGCQPGGGATLDLNSWAVEVGGEEISQREVEISVRRQALYDPDFDADEAGLALLRRQTAMQIAEQAVIAQKARKMGLAIGEDALSRYIISEDNPDFPLFTNADGRFDREQYRSRLTQSLGATSDAYRRAKEREVLAERYLSFLADQVQVSEPEVRAAFERARRTWNLEYVVIDPAEYAGAAAEPDAAAGAAYAQANAEKVAAYYEANKAEYDRDTEVKIRRVLIRKPKEGGEAAVAEAKQKAEDLRTQAMAEGADFEAIAREHSEGYYKSFGGDMGWQSKENTSEADYAVYSKLAAGQVSEVVESPIGFWFVKADEVKPAVKKSLDEVRDAIGAILVREDARMKAARVKADEVLARVKGGASLEAAMPAPAPPAAPEAPAVEEGGEGGAVEGGEAAVEGGAAAGEGGEAAGEAAPAASPVQTTGPFSADRPQWDRIPGIGKSAALATKLDDLTAEKPLVEEPVEVEGKLYIVRLKERTEADDAAYAQEKETFARRLRDQRAAQLLGNWQAVLFGPVRQREVFRRFSGGALLGLIEDADIELNADAYPPVAAAPGTPAPVGLP